MELTGKTKITGIFGYPIEHTLSPAMHNAAFEHLSLDYCYVPFSVRPEFLGNAVMAIRALNLSGINVTVPHKEKVIPFLDKVDKEASFIGAVNTILNSDGVLLGYNTDGRGFMEALSEAEISTENKTILILGAGGASKSISYYLSEKAAKLLIFDIDKNKAVRLVKELGNIRSNVEYTDNRTDLNGIEILINATPLGLKDTDPAPVPASLLSQDIVVCDLIYRDTPLLTAAASKGCKTLNGRGMLLHQGVLAFEIWTGIKPPVDVMRNAICLY